MELMKNKNKLLKKLVVVALATLLVAGCSPKTDTNNARVAADGAVRVDKTGVLEVDAPTTAPVVVEIYYDPACPACGIFGDATHTAVQQMTGEGQIEVVYRALSFLNGNTPDDYSARAGAYALAVAEYAPEHYERFMQMTISRTFQPANPTQDKTPDSTFTDMMLKIGVPQETVDIIDKVENKGRFVPFITKATKDFTSNKTDLLDLSPAENQNGQKYVFTPFVLVNKAGERTNTALSLENEQTLAQDLRDEVERVLGTAE